jgi:hypothetical protein
MELLGQAVPWAKISVPAQHDTWMILNLGVDLQHPCERRVSMINCSAYVGHILPVTDSLAWWL